jgi:hypothetical protein
VETSSRFRSGDREQAGELGYSQSDQFGPSLSNAQNIRPETMNNDYNFPDNTIERIKDLCGFDQECTADEVSRQVEEAAEEMLIDSNDPADKRSIAELEALSRERGLSYEQMISKAIEQYFQREAEDEDDDDDWWKESE